MTAMIPNIRKGRDNFFEKKNEFYLESENKTSCEGCVIFFNRFL